MTVFLLPIIIRYSNSPDKIKVDYLDGFSDDVFSSGRYVMMTISSKLKKETLVHEVAYTLRFYSIYFKKHTVDNDVIPTYIFEFGKTKNIMNYNNVLTFWKWQWTEIHKNTTNLEVTP